MYSKDVPEARAWSRFWNLMPASKVLRTMKPTKISELLLLPKEGHSFVISGDSLIAQGRFVIGHERGPRQTAKYHQVDYVLCWPELRSVLFTAAVNSNS